MLPHGVPSPSLEEALASERYRDSLANLETEAGNVRTMGFRHEGTATLCRLLAQAYAGVGRQAAAAKNLQRAVLLAGEADPASWRAVARHWLEAGDRRAAASALERALKENPQDVDSLLAMSQLLEGVRDIDQAIGYARMAWQVARGEPKVALVLGELYVARGENAAALEVYQISLAAHPQVDALRLALRRLQQIQR